HSGTKFYKLSLGKSHACAIATTGNAYCWGDGSKGQVGHYTQGSFIVPSPVYMNDVGEEAQLHFISLSEGLDNHTCARSSNGKTYCLGANGSNQLGLNEA